MVVCVWFNVRLQSSGKIRDLLKLTKHDEIFRSYLKMHNSACIVFLFIVLLESAHVEHVWAMEF